MKVSRRLSKVRSRSCIYVKYLDYQYDGSKKSASNASARPGSEGEISDIIEAHLHEPEIHSRRAVDCLRSRQCGGFGRGRHPIQLSENDLSAAGGPVAPGAPVGDGGRLRANPL